jgi:hypothetical protein
MGLSFTYEFVAPASTTARELETFLSGVERKAKKLGFSPTTVLNVPFDTPERRAFSRRLGGSFTIKANGLKGIALPAEGQVRDHLPESGECRVIPKHGVVLVVSDEAGCETCFGFFKFPGSILDIHGQVLADTHLGEAWHFRDFVNSPDPRLREIVKDFQSAGYAHHVTDDFA